MTEAKEAPPLKIAMRPSERKLYAKFIENINYLVEYGSGGSTKFAFEKNVWRVLSIENDLNFIEYLLKDELLNQMVKVNRLKVLHVGLGPCGNFGFPLSDPPEYMRQRYQTMPWQLMDMVPDVILVDGRYRLSVALRALLKFRADTIICFHDFWDRQSRYSQILNFTEVVESADRLAVLRAKSNFDPADVLLVAEAMKSDYW